MTADVLAGVRDRFGREIVITRKRWAAIQEKHPALRGSLNDVLEAITTAGFRGAGNWEGSERLVSQGPGPARWLVVIVDFSGQPNEVVTAYPLSRLRKGFEWL